MIPMISGPSDQFNFNSESNLQLFDDIGLAANNEVYVDSSTSDVDSSADIGTHSNFANQQDGPDSTYDTLTEANGAPPPTNSENDIDGYTSDVDSTPDEGIEGTFTNAQGANLDSSYFTLTEESVLDPYGGETGGVFVTGSVPDMAGNDEYAFYQAIFWNPTDDVYQVSRVEFSYTGSTWLKAIAQGSGSSSPTSGWTLTSGQVAAWTGTPITVQPHTASSFYVRGDSNKVRTTYSIDITITANSSTYSESYASGQSNRNRPAAQLWLGSTLPPTQIHSVATGTQTTVYVSLEEDDGGDSIRSGGTLTIDVPSGFTGITDIGGTNWGTATIIGNQITVSNTAAVLGSYITYAFQITSPSSPGLYKLDIAFDDTVDAHPIGNFTVHVTGTPPTNEKINLEYQWTTATYDDNFEEVCINVGSHTGSENLVVNYWDGFTWNVLGTISTTGWSNFTATGLSSGTYTIQLIGSSESSDANKDTWNIDLITLHTWSTQTYNYKLDLEIQWSSVNYTQDYEELCIYTGTLDTESIRVDVWTGVAWTNIATDLNADSWNNFTIGTWLTSSTFTIRFRGDLEVGDTTQSSWEIDCSLLHTWDNEIPSNSATPIISNLDDSTFLYANYREYQLTAEVTDLDGYTDIDYFELTLKSDDNLTEYWSIRYDEDTNSFTEQSDPSNYIVLNTSSSIAVEAGNTISATFHIIINWNHPDIVNTDIKSEVYDTEADSSINYYEVDWDFETRLDMSSGPILNDGSGTIARGDLDSLMIASGTITYLGSSLIPSASDIDVWILASEYGTELGPWEATNYEDSGGTFSATVYADDQVGQDDFTFKAVAEDDGASGTDHFSGSQTAQYIADRVQVQSYSADDSRINVDATASLHVVLFYDYDNSSVTDGSVTINGRTAIYSGSNGIWDFTDVRSTAQLVTYDTLVYSGGTHGITGEDQNGQSIDQIWDSVTVVSYSAVDARVDVNSNAVIDVTLIYEYDGLAVDDGSITINGASADHQGVGVWRITVSSASVQGITYNLVVASSNTHGITVVDQNSQSQLIIWDRVIVTGYTVADDRVNVDDNVNLDVTLKYEYNDIEVTDGTVTINLVSASHTVGGVWRITVSKSTVQNLTYSSVACSGNFFGISEVNQNSQSIEIIWDQIRILTTTVDYSRLNIDGTATIMVTAELEFDGHLLGLGDTLFLDDAAMTWDNGNSWFYLEVSQSVVGLWNYYVNTTGANDAIFGISQVTVNGQAQDVIWDQITVRSYNVIDSRVNLDDSVNIDVLLEYEYDDTVVDTGSVTINTISASNMGSGIWRITETKSSVQSITYDVVACSGNIHGITNVNQNSQSIVVIWDQVVVRSYSVQEPRVQISTVVTINFTLEYESDDTPVIDGIVTLNGIPASHVSGGVWEITQSRSSVLNVIYNNVQCSGNLWDIDNVNQNSQSQEIIWDQITVRLYDASDTRVNLDDSVNINVTLEYEYDDSPVTDGTVTINGFIAAYQSGGIWRISQTRGSVLGVTYDSVTCSGNAYDISSVNQNGQSQLVIWDQITVRGYEVSDARDNVGDPITITVELEYEYDDSDVTDGSVTINSLLFTYTGSLGKWSAPRTQVSVMAETFVTVLVSGNTLGITDVNQDGQSTTVIWDRIQVLTTSVDDGRIDTDTSCEIRVTLMLEYDSTFLGLGDTVSLNGVLMTWDSVESRFEVAQQQSMVGQWLYHVNSSLETTYGISALNVNSQEVNVIWDQIIILTTLVDADRVNVDSSVELRVTAQLAFDGHPLGFGDTIVMDSASMTWDAGDVRFELSRTKSLVGLWNFQVGSASEATYGITVVNLSGQSQDVIWDQLSVYIVADMDSVGNGIQVNFTLTVTYEYDLAACTTYNLKIARNGSHWHTFTSANVSDFYDTNSNTAYLYNASLITSESTYGITVFTTNTETVEWGAGTAAPINVATPVLTNPDDTDFMYARLRFYFITSNVSDAQTYSDINYVELSLWDNTRSEEIWRIRYTQATNAFSIESGSDYIQLGSCTYTKSGFNIDITWSIKIDWDHQDLSNIDFKQYVVDSELDSDENWYEADYDVETQLEYSVLPSLSDDRGDLDTSDLECSGTVVYYRSSLQPLANETEVWVLHDVSGTWSSDVDISGAFTVSSIASSSSVRLNTYTIKIVSQGNGSSGSDLYYTTSETNEFITDQIEFYLSGTDYARVNVGDGGVIWWNARYDYDNTSITSGLTAELNGTKTLLWDNGLSRWYYVEVSAIVDQIGYSISSASESGYGLTGWTQTASNVSSIWDQIVVRSYSVDDTRTNVSDFVNIDVLLEYDFDDSYVTAGAVLINSVSAIYQGSGIWRISETRSGVILVLYDTVSCSGNTHNITNVNQNGQSISVIWDRIIVGSYSVTNTRVSVNDNVNIDVALTFEYGGAFVLDATVTINGYPASHLGSGVWRITHSRSTVQSVTFDSVNCHDNTYGIAIVNQNSQSADVIWDQIVVQYYTVLDHRISVGDSANIDFVLHYDYDDSPVTDGSVSINSISAIYQGSGGIWRVVDTQNSVVLVTYDTVVCSGNFFDISSVNQNTQSESITWDAIAVRLYSVDDNRVDLNTIVVVNVSLEYEYDDASVVNGVVFIQSVSASHVGDGIWQITMSKSSVQNVTFNTVVCSGNLHGISFVNQSGLSTDVIWDKIIVRSYTVLDSRVNVDTLVNIDVLLEYEYDDSPVTIGTVTINGVPALHTVGGVWRISNSENTATDVTYNLVICSGNSYDINTIDQNSKSHTVIWDRIVVLSYQVLDTRVDIGDSVNVDVVLEYEYDHTEVTDGSVSINGIGTLYQSGGVWRISIVELTVGMNTYDSVTCSGNEHEITSVDQNGQTADVIWDQIAVRSLTASDERDNIGSTIIVYLSLEYEFDNSTVDDGMVFVNSIPFSYNITSGLWYTNRMEISGTFEDYDLTSVSGNDFDITEVNQNGESIRIIWDQIRILTTTVDDSRLSIDGTATIKVTAELEYDGYLLGSGDTLYLDDSLMTWDGIDSFYLEVSQSAVGLWNYYVNGTGALETTYGISQVTIAGVSQDVIWDSLTITITPDDTSVDDYDVVSFTMDVTYAYDSTSCTSYTIEISRDGAYWLTFTNLNVSLFEDTNIAVTYNYSTFDVTSEGTYGITAYTTNWVEVTWTTPANFAPFNNGAPKLLNPDDTDNMYAKLGLYMITSSFVDYDGYADVDYVELSLWDNNRLFEVWRIRYTSATQTFTIIAGFEYIQLSSSSTSLEAGYLLNVTWYIKIDWTHFDLQDVDLQQSVQDISEFSDLDWYEASWDIETRLDYDPLPSLSDNHGDVDTTDLQASGVVVYYGSLLHPLVNETDIWVIHDFSGSWSGSINSNGVISVTGIGSSSSVRTNTYTFKIVAAGQGSGSADLYYTTSRIDTFITDRIVFYLSGVIDSRTNINTQGDVWFRARYNYSGADIQSGLEAYLNGINLLSWDATYSRWHYQEVRASPIEILYQLSSATESVYGITTWVLDSDDQSIIWDSLIITLTNPTDQRINTGENATGITVSATYSFDSAQFNGTILLNNTVFSYSSVQRQYYTVTSVFGDIYGITAIAANDLTWCIWDQIEVVSITTNITYLDPSEYVRVQTELRYDFDDAPVESGNFSLKFVDLTHISDGVWGANITRLSYRTIIFDTLTICSGTAFDISSFDMYGNLESVYWDQLEIFESEATDSRIDVSSTGFIVWSIRLYYAGITISSGINAQASDGSPLTYVDGEWRSVHTSDVVGDITFTITDASLQGIDFFTMNTNDVTLIWDRIRVVTISATTTSPEIEKYVQVRATLVYEYDNIEVNDGSVTLWDEDGQITMVYNNSGGFWYANFTKVDIGNYTFYIAAVSGNQYGITVVESAGNTITIEFVPAILPRLTPMMVVTISSGFGIILIISAVLVRRRYRVIVPYEVQQINIALEAMEKGEKVEPLDVRTLEMILYAELEPGLIELGLTMGEVLGEISPEEVEDTLAADPQAELLDIMDEFKLPDYKQEIDEGELDISILSESESEEAWSTMLKEVRRIEAVEGRKVPLTKEDWIEKIPSEIKSIFFEEELRELDIAELEHLTQLTPEEVEEIMGSISQTEDMYASLEPEASAAAISSAISDRIEAQPTDDLTEAEKKERLLELLPKFVKEYFSSSWLEKLSSEEIEELLTIPESELKAVIAHISGSQEATDEADVEAKHEIQEEPEVEVVEDVIAESEEEPKTEDPADIHAELLAELKSELGTEIDGKPEVEPESEVDLAESVTEHDDSRMAEFIEKFGEQKANFLITFSESMLEGIPEDQIKDMDMETLEKLKEALKPDFAAEPDVDLESEDEPETQPDESEVESESESESEDERVQDLMSELGLGFEDDTEE